MHKHSKQETKNLKGQKRNNNCITKYEFISK